MLYDHLGIAIYGPNDAVEDALKLLGSDEPTTATVYQSEDDVSAVIFNLEGVSIRVHGFASKSDLLACAAAAGVNIAAVEDVAASPPWI